MSNELTSLIMSGDLSRLSSTHKLQYYQALCNSLGLNPLSKPFEYMRLNGKEVLYATKGAAEQLRNIKGISITEQSIEYAGDIVIVTVKGQDKTGRIDTETGYAPIVDHKTGKPLEGDAKGNALLKAITKAKRRLTLSMAGLGMLDETEVEVIPNAIMLPPANDYESQWDEIQKKLLDDPLADLTQYAEAMDAMKEQAPSRYESTLQWINKHKEQKDV